MIYENRLQSVGITITVNKTRFKSQLTAHFSDSCQETSDGRNTLLVFNDGFQKLLKDAMANRDIESEAISMAKLVKTIRMDMLDWAEYEFNGKFPPGCQEISVPASLKALVAMLLNGFCKHFEDEGLVCPPILRKGIFTVGAMDNIDHNPSSTSAQGSFHAQLEAAMRELFNVPKETVCRVWYKYNSSLYEELSMPEQTLQDAGLYAGQLMKHLHVSWEALQVTLREIAHTWQY
ncbi:hypothetical protein EMCRGX_G027332 [Ephydatia muelleri]